MTNVKQMIAHADSKADAAIKSSQGNAKVLQEAACEAIFIAAHVDIGNIDVLNKLINGVTTSDYQVIRLFFRSVIEKFGPKNDDGKFHSFLTYSGPNKKFGHNNKSEDPESKDLTEKQKLSLVMRKAIQEAGIEGLMAMSFKGPSRETVDRQFDPIEVTVNTIKRLASHGETALAKELNRVLGARSTLKSGDIEEIGKVNDPAYKAAQAKKRYEKLQAQADELQAKAAAAKPEADDEEKKAEKVAA